MDDDRRPAPGFGLLLFAFFCSGCAGLIYEVVWARRLTLIFGSTSLAISTVLAAYMAGLALGSWALGRVADRARDRVRLYALLEIGIGVYGLISPWLFSGLEALYRPLHHALDLALWPSLLLRFGLAFATLLLPTFFMGGTLPVLSRHLVEREDRLGRRLGLLYSTNTFGAVFGVLLTGFLLIPSIGVRWTTWTAAWINIWVGLLVWLLRRAGVLGAEAAAGAPGGTVTATLAAEASIAAPPDPTPASTGHRAVVLVFGIAGFASFVYEVAWTRILGLICGSASNAFAVMLASFLLGIALGSWVFSRWIDRAKDLVLFLARIEAALGVLTILLLPAFGLLPGLFVAAFPHLRDSYAKIMGFDFLLALATMLAPTLLIGATFPVVAKIYARGTAALGRRVGEVYVANTTGGILGSFVGGFVLLPQLSSPVASLVASGLNLACAAILVAVSPTLARGRRPAWAVAALLLGLPAWWVAGGWNPAAMTTGVYIYAGQYVEHPDWFEHNCHPDGDRFNLDFYEEGLNCITTVRRDKAGTKLLQVNGKTDASNQSDMTTQVLCAYWPLVVAPRVDEVLVVGLGSGVTAGAAARFPAHSLDVIEIERSVVNAAGCFRAENHDVLADPRIHLRIEDARNFVALCDRKYDVIVSEPSNPWMAGSSTLFTAEHFRNLAAVLKEDGVISQWVQTNGMNVALVQSVFRTFQEVFPHTLLIADPGEANDTILLGSRRPIRIREAALRRTLETPGLKDDLTGLGYRDALDLLTTVALSEGDLAAYAQKGVRNTDDLPLVEFETPKNLYHAGVTIFLDLAASRRAVEPPVDWEGEPRLEELFLRLAERFSGAGRSQVSLATLKLAAERVPQSLPLRLALGEAALKVARAEEVRLLRLNAELRGVQAAAGTSSAAAQALRREAQEIRDLIPDLLRMGEAAFAACAGMDPHCGPALRRLGELALSRRDFELGARRLAEALDAGVKEVPVYNNLAVAQISLGRFAEAETSIRAGLALSAEDRTLLENLAQVQVKQDRPSDAAATYDRLLALPLAAPERERIQRARAALPAGK